MNTDKVTTSPTFIIFALLSLLILIHTISAVEETEEDMYQGIIITLSTKNIEGAVYAVILTNPLNNTRCERYSMLFPIKKEGSHKHLTLSKYLNARAKVELTIKELCINGYPVISKINLAKYTTET